MAGEDDGLQWLLSLNVEQDEALGFLSTLDKMTSSLKGTKTETDKVEQATKKAGEGHKKHGKDAEHLEGALHHLIHAGLDPFLHKAKEIAEFEFIRRAVDKLIEAPAELIEKVKELGEEMIRSAAKAERTEKSFGLLFGHEGAEEMLAYVNKIKNATEFTAESLEGAVAGLGKIGFQGQGLSRALSAAQDLAALNPDKAAGFSEALMGLEQAKRTGQVTNRTLRPLGFGEKDFLKQLSKRTGEDVATLKKKLDAGKVDVEDSLETLYTMITQKTGKKLGGAGVDMSKTLGAQLTHIGEIPELYFKKLAKSPALDILTKQFGMLVEKLDPESPDGRRIFGALENVFKTIGDIMKTFDMASVVVAATDALETFVMMFLEALSLIPGETGTKAGFVLNNMKRNRESSRIDQEDRRVLAQQNTTSEFETEADYADLDQAAKSGALGEKSKAYAHAADLGKAIGQGVAVGVKESTPDAAGAVGDMADGSIGTFKDKAKIYSPSQVFAELGRMTAAGYVEGIEASAASVDEAVGAMFQAPKPRAGAGGLGSSVVVAPGAVSVVIHVPAGSGLTAEDVAQAAARAVESALPGAFKSGLDQMAAQGGEN